jgi:hypothetical protein
MVLMLVVIRGPLRMHRKTSAQPWKGSRTAGGVALVNCDDYCTCSCCYCDDANHKLFLLYSLYLQENFMATTLCFCHEHWKNSKPNLHNLNPKLLWQIPLNWEFWLLTIPRGKTAKALLQVSSPLAILGDKISHKNVYTSTLLSIYWGRLFVCCIKISLTMAPPIACMCLVLVESSQWVGVHRNA